MVATEQLEIDSLLSLSARIGANPLLVQASSGNTSVKLDDRLWIKASGKWLASALEDDCLVPVSLPEAVRCVREGREFTGLYRSGSGCELRASIETAMHAVLPNKVVVHVHSVNTIAWAVRRDGPEQLTSRLNGLDWAWVSYVASGLALALAIEKARHQREHCQVFILENHGLVVCAESCEAAQLLLDDVERRLSLEPRSEDTKNTATLLPVPGWRLPCNSALHALGLDPVSRGILRDGVLYPCQAIFLTPCNTLLRSASELRQQHIEAPFVIISGQGVLVQEGITRTQAAVLDGLMHVVQRLQPAAPIRYLLPSEVDSLLTVDAYRYRQSVEANASTPVGV